MRGIMGQQMARKTSILFILPRQHKGTMVMSTTDVRAGSLGVRESWVKWRGLGGEMLQAGAQQPVLRSVKLTFRMIGMSLADGASAVRH